MTAFEDNFWRSPAPQFPNGCDPYNTVDEIRRQKSELISAMEAAWRSCVQSGSKPGVMIVSRGFIDALYDYFATPDRGHEFYPYG